MFVLQALRSRIDEKTIRFCDKSSIYWNGGLESDIYGRIYVYFDDRMPRKIRVHRSVYSLHHFQNIALPSRNNLGCTIGIFHLCHKPRCCNVPHLNLESHQINMSRLFCMRTGPNM